MTLAHPAIDWPHDRIAPSIARVQNMLLWFIGFGGAIVFIEPSPYEIGTLLAMAFFIASGLRFNPTFIPLAALLFALNLGYSICAAYLMNDSQIVFWILTSWYMGVTALFFAMVFSENTAERFHALARGLIIGAVVASLLGIGGYFHLLPGYDTLTLYGRVRGTFKDPRVHYSVNCASIGCPNLMREAFTGASLERQLDAGARAYVNHSRGIDITRGKVKASSIYDWFAKDFGGNAAGVLEHVRRYAGPELKRKLEGISEIAEYGYDWSLNDAR